MSDELIRMKPWWQSRTVWLGLLELVIGLLDVTAGSGLTGESADGALLAIVGMLTILLRYLTRQPIQPLRTLAGSHRNSFEGR